MSGASSKLKSLKEGIIHFHSCAVVQDSYFRHVPPVLQPYPLRLFHAEEFNVFGGCIYRVVDEFGNGIRGVVVPTVPQSPYGEIAWK